MEEQKLDEIIKSYRELMTPTECAEYLGISRNVLSRMTGKGLIPFESVSPNCKRYRKSTLDIWLKDNNKGGYSCQKKEV